LFKTPASFEADFFKNLLRIQPLIKYLSPKIKSLSATVRFFNDELTQWIIDMRDTITKEYEGGF